MLILDHVVVHVNDNKHLSDIKQEMDQQGILFEPSWGKKAKGFQISNIWVGKQYFEIVNILQDDNLWQPQWSTRHRRGDRGVYCVFFKLTTPIAELHQKLVSIGVNVTVPERTEFKWFFGLFKKKLPWQFMLTEKIPGTDIELGFIEYDEGAEKKFVPFMVPNCTEAGLMGLTQATVYSTHPTEASSWLVRLEQAVGHSLDLSVEPTEQQASLRLGVEVTDSSGFSGAKLTDVILQPAISSVGMNSIKP